MAQFYKVPEDTSEKEKVIGGVLTAAQGGWLALGFILCGGIFLLCAQIMPPLVALILAAIPSVSIALPFAFLRIKDLSLLSYIILRREYKHQPKQIVNTLTNGKKFND